jgi:hypothetical protein
MMGNEMMSAACRVRVCARVAACSQSTIASCERTTLTTMWIIVAHKRRSEISNVATCHHQRRRVPFFGRHCPSAVAAATHHYDHTRHDTTISAVFRRSARA